jgi:methionyl-tRNA formyltransferase
MTPGLDAGPCLAQQRTPIDPDEDAAQLEARLAKLGAAVVLQVIDDLENNRANPVHQDKSLTSKAPRLKKEQGAIDWSRAAHEIKNQVRALRPWPRAYTFLHRPGAAPLRLNIDRVAFPPTAPISSSAWSLQRPGAPGSIVESDPRLLITTADIPLEVLELQPAGKRSMSAQDFLRGYHIETADYLGPA